MRRTAGALALLAGLLALAGCEDRRAPKLDRESGVQEETREAGEAIGEGAEKTGEEAERAGERLEGDRK